MWEAAKKAMESLAVEFGRAAVRYPPLYHQQVLSGEATAEWAVSGQQWGNFVLANSTAPPGGGQAWHGPYQGRTFDWLGRFHGDLTGLEEFKQLAGSLYHVLRKEIPQHVGVREGADPQGFPVASGYGACLEFMHEVADSWPLPLLRSDESVWGDDGTADAPAAWSGPRTDERAYPIHPLVESIENNLFVAARSLIEFVLDPDTAFFISDGHWFDVPFGGPAGADDAGHEVEEASTSDGPGGGENVFKLSPDHERWQVVFRHGPDEGDVVRTTFPDREGFRHIAFMLGHPNQEVPCLTVDAPAGDPSARSAVPSSEHERGGWGGDGYAQNYARAEDAVDQEGLRRLNAELNRLRGEIEEAGQGGDEHQLRELEDRRDQVLAQVKRYTTPSGRIKKVGESTDARKAAKRVRIAIERAVGAVRGKAARTGGHDALGLKKLVEHLGLIRVQGTTCTYRVAEPRDWATW